MLFNSLLFLIFFTAVVCLYWTLSGKYRWILLVLASFVFYGVYVPAYTVVLAVSVLANYGFGRWIGNSTDDRKRKWLLVWGIVINIGILGLFKYSNEFIHVFNFNLQRVLLPLGISFFTFTNLSYLIEVKRRKWEPEHHLGYFTVFVTFFPKLIQGPIERPQTFMPQVKEPRTFNYDRAVGGLRLMLWGFFKKLVIADRLALAVNPVYENPQNYSGPAIIVATIFYSIQIYADFSGYIDIVRGAGKVLGFELLKNFNIPYAAKSIRDFWARWHMSLSNWLRDYMFLPVAYSLSRKLKKDRYLGMRTDNILYSVAITVTFLLCGIWHGVGWTFLLWGALYAVYLVIGHLTEKHKKRFYHKIGFSKIKWLYNTIQVFVTFTLITVAWSLFRANSISDVIVLFSNVGTGWISYIHYPSSIIQQMLSFGYSFIYLISIILIVSFMFITESPWFIRKVWGLILLRSFIFRWALYYVLLLIIFLLGQFDQATFIYSQF